MFKGGVIMYIPLNNKSNYTLLSSLLKIDDIIDYAIYNKIPCISLCDTNMFGMMEFINKCNKNNIKPIVGLNVILYEFQLYLFVKNYDGYKNLIKLSTIQSERVVLIDDLKNIMIILFVFYLLMIKISLILLMKYIMKCF